MRSPENATEHPRLAPPVGGAYHVPGPETEAETGFRREAMVPWLSPAQLGATAVRAVLSGVFGSYADRRELLAALNQPQVHDYSGPEHADGMWIDYAADLGDGFDATYTVAWLLAQPALAIPARAGEPREGDPPPHATERGRILVLGGDQVYPTASRDEYANRMAGPYRAALPSVDVEGATPPHLFAIPGNHDWYDGLTAFIRLFCQKRWIGGWETQQSRSYWAAKLPHGWWILGTDIQLQSDVDAPQMAYFASVAARMEAGDRVILCTAEPSWVHTPGVETAFDNLAFFEQAILAKRGAHLALTLTGDLHHYAHYVEDDPPPVEATRTTRTTQTGGESEEAKPAAPQPEPQRHKITAGGGGAYILGTQGQPAELHLREKKDGPTHRWKRTALFPSADDSYVMRWGAPLGVLRTWRFCLILGVVYALYAWFLENTSLRLTSPEDGTRGTDWMMRSAGDGLLERLPGALADAAWLVGRTPGLLLFSVALVAAMCVFATPDDVRKPHRKWIVGIAHGALHVAAVVVLAYLLARMLAPAGVDAERAAAAASGMPAGGFPYLRAAAVLLLMVPAGGIVGGVIFGLFLLPGVNLNEAFSAQAIEGYRNFLRMRLDADGTLTVYPVGVERAARWRFRPRAPAGEPWYAPDGDAPRPHLIEPPFTLAAPVRPASDPGPRVPS